MVGFKGGKAESSKSSGKVFIPLTRALLQTVDGFMKTKYVPIRIFEVPWLLHMDSFSVVEFPIKKGAVKSKTSKTLMS
jgi:hypothetical protein